MSCQNCDEDCNQLLGELTFEGIVFNQLQMRQNNRHDMPGTHHSILSVLLRIQVKSLGTSESNNFRLARWSRPPWQLCRANTHTWQFTVCLVTFDFIIIAEGISSGKVNRRRNSWTHLWEGLSQVTVIGLSREQCALSYSSNELSGSNKMHSARGT